MVLLQVIEEHDQNLDKKLNILEYRGFLEEEVRGFKRILRNMKG